MLQIHVSILILQSDALNLDRYTLWQLLSSNAASSRLVAVEVLLVSHIHARKVCHVVKENTGLNNPAQVTPSSFQDCPHVVKNNILQ